jgi:hypothetical protein
MKFKVFQKKLEQTSRKARIEIKNYCHHMRHYKLREKLFDGCDNRNFEWKFIKVNHKVLQIYDTFLFPEEIL